MITTTSISHSKPWLGQNEIHAVTEVIQSHQIGQGWRVDAFEQSLATYLGVRGGVAVSSGTAALHLALLALGVGPGDEIIMPSYVCTAPWIATTRIGAIPKIVDIEPTTYNIDPEKVKEAITGHTRALIVPHLFGLPANVTPLKALKVPVIEDCAQTLGATYNGRAVGSLGNVTICSFYATKLLCTGEGGMVLSNNPATLEAVRALRAYDEKRTLNTRSFNFKMTDLHAALGTCQLDRLQENLERRADIAARYFLKLGHLPIELPFVPDDRTHIFYRFVLKIAQPLDDLLERLERKGVQGRRPVYQPIHRYLGLKGYPNSDQAFSSTLSIPIYPSLSDEEVEYIITVLCEELG